MATRTLGYVTLALLAIATYGIFFVARPIAGEGDAGRIVYFHVPMAWDAFLAFFVVFGASIAYLRTGNPRWDYLGRASAEVGLVFTTLVLITGAIWGYPIWGTWWSWDPKLTTTLILWFMYLAYLMVRSYAEPPRGPRFAAVVGIVAFVDVPIVYMSSYWWRTLHPPPAIGPLAQQQPSATIVWILLLSLVAFTLLYAFLVRVRMEIESTESALDLETCSVLGLDQYAPFLLSAFGITLLVLVGYLLYLRSRLTGARRRAAALDATEAAYSARNVTAAAPRATTAQAASSANGPSSA